MGIQARVLHLPGLVTITDQVQTHTDSFNLGEDFYDIWEIHPRNAILLKVSYRIGR